MVTKEIPEFLRKAGGRPRWEPTAAERESIKNLASNGIPQVYIAQIVGTSRATLQRRCREELRVGTLIANARVAFVAFNLAVSGKHPKMTRFWLSKRGGWKQN